MVAYAPVEAAGYFEIFVTMHKIMQCHKPEDHNLNFNEVPIVCLKVHIHTNPYSVIAGGCGFPRLPEPCFLWPAGWSHI